MGVGHKTPSVGVVVDLVIEQSALKYICRNGSTHVVGVVGVVGGVVGLVVVDVLKWSSEFQDPLCFQEGTYGVTVTKVLDDVFVVYVVFVTKLVAGTLIVTTLV